MHKCYEAHDLLSAKAKLLLCKSKIITEGWQPEPSCRAALHVWEKPACFPCWHFVLLTNVGAFGRMEPSSRLRCRIPRRGGSVGRGLQRSWVRQCWLQGSPPHCRVVMGPFFPLKQLHSHLSLPPVGVTGVFSFVPAREGGQGGASLETCRLGTPVGDTPRQAL